MYNDMLFSRAQTVVRTLTKVTVDRVKPSSPRHSYELNSSVSFIGWPVLKKVLKVTDRRA